MSKPKSHPSSRLIACFVCGTIAVAAACGEDTAGPGPSVVFITQPNTAVVGEPIDPPVEVMVRSGSGRPLSRAVTLALDPNPCGFQLSGTLTVQVSDTTARFGDLVMDKVGRGYTLRASSDGANAVSEPFNVLSGSTTGPLNLENVLCLQVHFHGDGESLSYVPEDDSFWIADDNQESLFEVYRRSGAHGSDITLETILGVLPDAGQCDDGDGNPDTACSYVDNFELVAYDPAGRSLYVVNVVDVPSDRPAIFRLTKQACAGCFTPESWQPLPVGSPYRGIVMVEGELYMALGDRIYPYDYDTNHVATVDANGDSLPPAYETPAQVAGLSYDGTFLWIVTRASLLYQVEWATRTEHGLYELDPFGLSLPRGLEVVGDTIYIVEGDAPNQIYVLTQRQP